MTQAERDLRRRLTILENARQTSNVSETCRFFGISRSAFYEWRQRVRTRRHGRTRVAQAGSEEADAQPVQRRARWKILRLRNEFHFGAQRIVWLLRRYEDIKVSITRVAATSRRHGVARLPRGTPVLECPLI
jgi:transposase